MRSGGWIGLALGATALSLGAGLAANYVADRQRLMAHAHAMTGGEPEAGRAALARRPCGGCHAIPGVAGATGAVAASLDGFASRVYIDGRLQNTPDNLVAWSVDPHAIDPPNAMPATGVSRREARDMAAYLYTLTP